MACGCNDTTTTTPCVSLCPDATTGCPIQLDFDCVIYHKDNSEINQLSDIGLTNGATLGLFAETVSSLLAGIKVDTYNIPHLRSTHTINTLKQLAEAVDVELTTIASEITSLEGLVNLPITAIDSQSIDLTLSGTNSHTVKADVKVSPQANNLFSILADGVYAAPQSLAVDYSTKTLTISNGNSVSLAGLSCGVGGFLGVVTVDPGAVLDGQYWYNTTSPSVLKIKLNGVIKTISLS
jgi:hypothetical protein